MIKNKLSVVLIALGLFVFTFSNCAEEEPLESCAQDEVCSIAVTSCCTVDGCVWKYDGKEYDESQESELADDLGCNSGGARVAAEQKAQLIHRLQTIMEKARAGLH